MAEIPHEACRLVEDLLRCLREEDLGSLFLLFGKQSTGDFTQGKFRRIGGIQLPEKVPAVGRVGGRHRNHRVTGAAAAQHIRLGRKDDNGVLHAVCVGQHGAANLFHQGRLAAAHVAHQHGGVLPAAAVVQRQSAGQAYHRLHTPRRGWDRSLQLLSFQKTFHRLCPFVSGVSFLHSEKGSAAVPGWKTVQKIKKAEGTFLPHLCSAEKFLLFVCPLAGCELVLAQNGISSYSERILRPLAGCELNLVAAILSTKRAQVFRPLAGCELVRCHHQPNGVCIQLASVPLRGVSWFA